MTELLFAIKLVGALFCLLFAAAGVVAINKAPDDEAPSRMLGRLVLLFCFCVGCVALFASITPGCANAQGFDWSEEAARTNAELCLELPTTAERAACLEGLAPVRHYVIRKPRLDDLSAIQRQTIIWRQLNPWAQQIPSFWEAWSASFTEGRVTVIDWDPPNDDLYTMGLCIDGHYLTLRFWRSTNPGD